MNPNEEQTINIYCDESHPNQKDGQSFMVIGALVCQKNDYPVIRKDIQDIKKRNGFDSNFEFKWQKINKIHFNAYVELIDYVASCDSLKVKINLALGKDLLKFYGINYGYKEWYHKMYFNMLRNFLNFHKSIQNNKTFHLLIDRKETVSDTTYAGVASMLQSKFSGTFVSKACDSKEYILIQCVDVIIGAVSYYQKHNYVSKYKTALMKHIGLAFNIDFETPTKKSSDKVSFFIWHPKMRK